jgi:hypothetical protein
MRNSGLNNAFEEILDSYTLLEVKAEIRRRSSSDRLRMAALLTWRAMEIVMEIPWALVRSAG